MEIAESPSPQSCRVEMCAAQARTTVTDEEWKRLRAALRDEAHRWLTALGSSRELDHDQLNIVIGSIAHLAYHLGAVRQIDRATRGPTAEEELAAKQGARSG